ncbi:hypothetical protein F5146DRAFT_1142693 [Armillaria mellea]|nr:hypothetical protein F5146DRAFT_1142693 [Armillaria mellea]
MEKVAAEVDVGSNIRAVAITGAGYLLVRGAAPLLGKRVPFDPGFPTTMIGAYGHK